MRGTEKFTYRDIPYEVIDAGRLEYANSEKRQRVLMVEPVEREALDKHGS